MTEDPNDTPIDANGDDASASSEGRRQRRAFMPRQLADQDWLLKHVGRQDKGTRVVLARFYGVCTDAEEVVSKLPNGETRPTVLMKGSFEVQNGLNGELSSVTQAYLPMAFAEQVKAAFDADKETISVDIDIDLAAEATGKPIPYEWVVISHVETKMHTFLNRMRERRRPAVKMGVPFNAAQPLLIEEDGANVPRPGGKRKPGGAPPALLE